MRIENIDEILAWDMEQLWNAVTDIKEENPDDKKLQKEIQRIKNGINIQIPLCYIINGWFEEHPENKRATIKGHGKVDVIQLDDEIDARKSLMRKIIRENQEDNDPTEAR